jgi:hypothetical protein
MSPELHGRGIPTSNAQNNLFVSEVAAQLPTPRKQQRPPKVMRGRSEWVLLWILGRHPADELAAEARS